MPRWSLAPVVVASVVACGPRCIKWHYETRHVDEYCHMEHVIDIGDMPIYAWTCDPPYDFQQFVCDQFEVERER